MEVVGLASPTKPEETVGTIHSPLVGLYLVAMAATKLPVHTSKCVYVLFTGFGSSGDQIAGVRVFQVGSHRAEEQVYNEAKFVKCLAFPDEDPSLLRCAWEEVVIWNSNMK